MSKNESIKSELDLLKGLIYLLITALFAVCGFFANTYKNADILDLAFIVAALLVLGVFLIAIFKRHIAKLKELEKLKERK